MDKKEIKAWVNHLMERFGNSYMIVKFFGELCPCVIIHWNCNTCTHRNERRGQSDMNARMGCNFAWKWSELGFREKFAIWLEYMEEVCRK